MKGTKSEVLQKLQDANKKLRAKVRSLRKQLKAALDDQLLLQELWQTEIVEIKKHRRSKRQAKKEPVCPECGNPGYEVKEIGVWVIERCDACEHFNREQKSD